MVVLSIAPRFAVVALSIVGYAIEQRSKQSSIIAYPVDTLFRVPRRTERWLERVLAIFLFITVLDYCDLKSSLPTSLLSTSREKSRGTEL